MAETVGDGDEEVFGISLFFFTLRISLYLLLFISGRRGRVAFVPLQRGPS
jgi:hypothetical protein